MGRTIPVSSRSIWPCATRRTVSRGASHEGLTGHRNRGIEMRVLLIEDDKMVGAAVEQALRDAAYAVDWVTDGETAIHAAENEVYEAALLDLGLPAADGRAVLRGVRP